MKKIIYIASLALTIFCCKDQSSQPEVNDYYEKWLSYQLHDYTIDQTRSCFCINGGQAMRVTIRKDTVMKVIKLSDNTVLPYGEAKQYITVDSLFAIIRNPKGDSLVVTYNQKYGFPEKLDINPQQHPVDGGILYITTNLQIP